MQAERIDGACRHQLGGSVNRFYWKYFFIVVDHRGEEKTSRPPGFNKYREDDKVCGER
jgi:hypothetical protein